MASDTTGRSDDPELEQRLRRLEDSLAQIQDLRQLEDHVVERLARRLPAPSSAPSGGHIIETGSRILDATRHLLSPAAPSVPAAPPHPESGSLFAHARPLLILELVAEARAIVRMFVDPRYNLSWYARLMPLVLILAIFTSMIWIPGIHFMPDWLATVVSKLVDLLLAYVLFKFLSREARRYRETAPDLPHSLRL